MGVCGVYCAGCNFNLRGLAGDRCPECGREFDRRDARTFAARPRSWVSRNLWRIALALALSGALGLGAWVAVPMWRERPIRFESARWKSTPAEFNHTSVRQRMVDDLLRSHALVGKTRAEVESLLGPADNTAYFAENDMVYMLGQERHTMFAIDSEWLVIKLDGAGRVERAKLVTD